MRLAVGGRDVFHVILAGIERINVSIEFLGRSFASLEDEPGDGKEHDNDAHDLRLVQPEQKRRPVAGKVDKEPSESVEHHVEGEERAVRLEALASL